MTVEVANHGVPETVARIIASKGLKKKFVAERVGMTAQRLSDIMANRRVLKMCDLVALSSALGVTPNDLFK